MTARKATPSAAAGTVGATAAPRLQRVTIRGGWTVTLAAGTSAWTVRPWPGARDAWRNRTIRPERMVAPQPARLPAVPAKQAAPVMPAGALTRAVMLRMGTPQSSPTRFQ